MTGGLRSRWPCGEKTHRENAMRRLKQRIDLLQAKKCLGISRVLGRSQEEASLKVLERALCGQYLDSDF